MKLADYVAEYLVSQGIKHVFVVSGGAAIHMIDSVARNPKIDYICSQHEQHSGAEADGYSRISNNLGAVIVTSGPGGTNLATSIANAYYDSIPIIFLCGQVSTFRLKKNPGLRQKGFQETDIVGMFKPITKYASQLLDSSDIGYELEKATYFAREGRPGPVVLDIPDDLSRSEIDPKKIKHFHPPKTKKIIKSNLITQIKDLDRLIQASSRPVLIVGAGVGIADSRREAIRFAEFYHLPCAHTFGGADIMPSSHKLNIGTIGVCGPRSGNFALQTSDLIIAIGTRLSPMVTGGKPNLFAPHAKKVMIDIDPEEFIKFTKQEFILDLAIRTDAKNFFAVWEKQFNKKIKNKLFDKWLNKIKIWEDKYPICPASYFASKKQIQPHVFIKELAKLAKQGDVIVGDTGANLCWLLQAWETKKDQRIISAWSHTPMGYALPASIGAAFTTHKNILCLIGDGGLMMCLQELATVIRYHIPIKIFIFNNHGHSIQKQTLETWLKGRFSAVDVPSGLSFPDFQKVAKAFGISTLTLDRHQDLSKKLLRILSMRGPVLVNVEIDPDARIVPMLKFGAGLENMDPKLPEEELSSLMGVLN